MKEFNLRETEINKHYWSFIASSEHSAYRARKYQNVHKDAPTSRLFRASGADAPRIPSTVSKWLEANDDLKNWLRLSVLVSAASNFEMFLGHVSRTALASDPFVRHGSSRAIDGVSLLKGGLELPYEDVIEGLTKGDWNSRESFLMRIFGVKILIVHHRKGELEEIRKIRNDFAHGFGRSISVPQPGFLSVSRSQSLSQDRLKRYLGLLSSVAKSIDRHLMGHHIGHYEMLCHYHRFEAELSTSGVSVHKALKSDIYKSFGATVTERFCRDLIRHYELCPIIGRI
ncbi:hypothetical protein [Citreimonas salinaria]|nr:hypothetical protein [Citreimonas salinaria]